MLDELSGLSSICENKGIVSIVGWDLAWGLREAGIGRWKVEPDEKVKDGRMEQGGEGVREVETEAGKWYVEAQEAACAPYSLLGIHPHPFWPTHLPATPP